MKQKLETPGGLTAAHTCCDSEFKALCLSALKEGGFRVTKPRLAVIECLEKTDHPLSPKAIFEQVKHLHGGEIDQVSVYRILEAFGKLGVIHQIFPSGEYVRCHTHTDNKAGHVLLNCILCGRASEAQVDEAIMHSVFQSIKNTSGFESQNLILQMNGKCKDCL